MSTQPVGQLERVRTLATTARLLFVGGERVGQETVITVYDHHKEKPQATIEVPAYVASLVANDEHVFAGCSDGTIRIFEHDGKPAREIDGAHEGGCTSLALRGDDLLSGGADGSLRLWSAKSGKKKKEWALSKLALRTVAIDPTGESLAGAGDDGVIRVIRLASAGAEESLREMPGHDGPVKVVLFTPSDGRLVSGGEDGTVRIWYLVGAIESEIRAKDDTLHVGGTNALLFTPAKDPAEYGERLVSAGADGKLRVWRMSERRKPRSFDAGTEPLYALAWAAANKAGTIGSLLTAGDSRTIYGFAFDADGQPTDKTFKWEHGLDVLAAALGASAKGKREEAVRTLAEMGEREALDLLIKQIASDKDADVRALIATELASHERKDAKKAIRARLDDDNAAVRGAALDALRKLEADAPLSPLRSALESRFADTRVAALRLLPALTRTSPLAAGLIASRLADDDGSVRRAALAELVGIHEKKSTEPLRTAFERGKADIRAEVLVRGALSGLTTNAEFTPLVGKALDDEDADVRRVAFVITALTRPTLGAWLEKNDEAFGRALTDIVRRAAEISGKGSAPAGADPDQAEVKSVSTAFAQFVHPKHGDIAIFKPNVHTPIKPGDKVWLIDIKPVGPEGHQQLRARDYTKEAPASDKAQDEVRQKLVGKTKGGEPSSEEDREPLLSALACRTPDTSLRGARGLALLGDMRALGALLTLSREPDAALRRESAIALVALEDPRAKRRLVWMLNDAEASVRDAALECYAKLEPDPIMVAEAALHSSHEDVRVRGLDSLVKAGKSKPGAETLLGDSIEDEAAKVRGEAFRTLWSWHSKDPLVPLDRALTARFPDLRTKAVQELTAIAKKKDDKLAGAALERLAKTIADRDLGVARAAYDATIEIKGKTDYETHLAAIATTHPALRIQGAKDATKDPIDKVRSPLSKLLEDTDAGVRIAAIETLDILLPTEHGAIAIGLQSSHLDLRVRAAELLATRREESIIDPMRALLADKDLLVRLPPPVIVPLRQRAATALANLGTPRLLKYFATELVKDDDPIVREQAARGLSNSSRRGEEGYLLDLLGHEELAVRSWAAEGLARLGDARALPVLTGTLRHDHAPIRVGAVLSFAALGPEGYSGMLQGLEDPSREVQRVVLAVILARDLRAFRKSETPDLLTSALSSQRPEVRFAAARALELRIVGEQYTQYLVDLLMPDKPEKAADMERWPDEETRARLMIGLAEALAGERPEQRYAAAQALRLRDRPIDYFREIQRAVAPRSVKTPWVPDTTPRAPAPAPEEKKKGPLALLRRLFARGSDVDAAEDKSVAEPSPVPADEQERLRMLAFGAYVGLLRQATADDEAHRTRRDAIDRIIDLISEEHVSLPSATPALARALDDPNHLVRQAAFAALKKVYAKDTETPLSLALASSSADVIRAALDELATRGEESKPRIVKALDSRVAQARKYAFDLLEKLSPPGSLEPLLAALGSEHSDIRIGVLERLGASQDARVSAALGQALQSDHDDLRLRAAEMLAQRKDDRAADALAPWLRAEDAAIAERARAALSRLGSAAAVRALSARLEDEVPEPERIQIANAIAATRAGESAIDALAELFADDSEQVRAAAFQGCLTIVGPRADSPRERGKPKPKSRDAKLSTRFFEPAVKSKHADVRLLAARQLDDLSDTKAASSLLTGMFADRDRAVRAAAVKSYSKHVEEKRLPARPLEDVLRAGARETMLAAALGLAHETNAAALRPLLLFARAGEEQDRQDALLGLGVLGDKRALPELETIAAGGTEEAPAEVPQQAAALEALGRILGRLTDGDDRERVRDKVEGSVGSKEQALAIAAVKALRWIGDERSFARIIAILAERSSSEPEQIEAAKALGKLPKDATETTVSAAEAALAKALDIWHDSVRWAAREALEELFPNDRTRIEFHAVESDYDDISEPAATYLATEGDAGLLLAKLAKLKNESLRQRLRFGLVRRASIPAADLEKLFTDPSAAARADAAWVAGGRSKSADTKKLASAIVAAAKKAEKGFADATKAGKEDESAQEERAWLYAVWAARQIDATAIRPDAKKWLPSKDVPEKIRVESAFALHGGDDKDKKALQTALSDIDGDVRSASAWSLSPTSHALTLKASPLDPVRLAITTTGAELDEKALGSSEGRQVYLPRAWRDGDTERLRTLAAKEGDAQLDAIAALGRAATEEAIEALTELVSEDNTDDEETRKAAFRSLRRAQRIAARKEALKEKEAT